MRESPSYAPNTQPPRQGDWTTAIAIAIAIVICLVAFVWIFVRLDPYLSDFISDDSPTPTLEASPTALSSHRCCA